MVRRARAAAKILHGVGATLVRGRGNRLTAHAVRADIDQRERLSSSVHGVFSGETVVFPRETRILRVPGVTQVAVSSSPELRHNDRTDHRYITAEV